MIPLYDEYILMAGEDSRIELLSVRSMKIVKTKSLDEVKTINAV